MTVLARTLHAMARAAAALLSLLAGLGAAAAPEDERPRPAESEQVAGGARIGRITLLRRDVFDTREPGEDRLLYRWANALHLETREQTIRERLLFKPGDAYDPRLLQESERLLRATGYLRDASIRAVATHDGPEGAEVDIEVVTQDVWTLKPGISFGRKGGKNSSSLGIEESNLLGFGTQLGLDLRSGVDRSTRTIFYRDRQLFGSQWDLSGQYARNSDGYLRSAALVRPFYALDSRWTAGAEARDETRVDSSYEQGQVVGEYQTHERFARAFVGWSAGLQDGWARRWRLGVTRDEHRAAPLSGLATLPADRVLAYPWVEVSWVQDQFEETRNQDQIGKTEDVALGWSARLLIGMAAPVWGADRRARVFEAEAAKGWRWGGDQTLLMSTSASGRSEDEGLMGTLLSGSLRYYLRQSARRSLYLALSSDRGINLDTDQQVLLGGDSGLRGYPLRYQSGKGRWVFTAEQRWFSEWYPWRLFNVGGAVFYDMGRAWDQDARTQQPQGLLRDVGFGLRLGNSRSALGNVVHLDVAFPLDGDPSIKKVQFTVEAKRSF